MAVDSILTTSEFQDDNHQADDIESELSDGENLRVR